MITAMYAPPPTCCRCCPELVLIGGAFALLMLDLFLDERRRVITPCASRIAVLVVAAGADRAAASAGRAPCSAACSCATPRPTC